MFKKIIAGSELRKTRFHDESGNLISLARLIRNGSRAVASGVARLALDYREVRPWISYDAQAFISSHLNSTSRVLEFGSGMSTIWLAKKCGYILSIENWEPWFKKVSPLLRLADPSEIKYEFRDREDSYCSISKADAGEGFDFILVDGNWRDQCVANSIDYLRPHGILYIDNSDRGPRPAGSLDGDMPRARTLALEYARRVPCDVRYFTDFAPTQLFVQQGMLVQRRA